MLPHPGRRARSIAALMCVAAVCMTGCAKKESTPDSSASAGDQAATGEVKLIEAGKLKVCTGLPYKPFEYKDSSGKIVGFDVDLVDALAKKVNATTEMIDIPFEQISTGLVFKSKKCDIAAAGMTITPERQKSILFSDPYFDATQALLVKKDSPYKSLADLKGKVLAVQSETTGKIYAEKNKADNGYTMKFFKDLGLMTAALKAGTVDAVLNDNGVVHDFAKENPTTAVVKEFSTGEQYGMGAGQGDPNAKALIAKMNEVIKETKSSGEYNTMYKKWFGAEPSANS